MYGIAAILGGMLCICGSVFDFEFFFKNYRARPFVDLFGRNGARIFYIVLGIFLIIAGIAIIFGK